MDPSTQKTIIYGVSAVVLGYAAYQVYVSMTASSSSPAAASSQPSRASAAAKKPAYTPKPKYTPKGDATTWSEDDMVKFLESRDMGVGLEHSSKQELLAMVESKLHEPTNTGSGFNDPQEWSSDDLKEYLRSNNLAVGSNPSRMELVAMVEAKMHAPHILGYQAFAAAEYRHGSEEAYWALLQHTASGAYELDGIEWAGALGLFISMYYEMKA
ncbi:hypothetical protein LTR56_001539 [Elasticomyces elasticus]|nr:hypothetical protein LTR56_001539 [Elasticomyces elasticus]KAK5768578.1 hypothetical protein LTS12_001366 [Elasticomyces elasticus]